MRLHGALTASVFTLAVLMAEPARATVYTFTDASGVTHFTNIPSDPRYAGMTRVPSLAMKP